ncbi:MAG: septal ring lytic transglycosylase RlpA family protein [Proteobacteria bacterium]|nr:septal ring lytic transglycosylase RlpA family protein [Pseudomonadota bacterium]
MTVFRWLALLCALLLVGCASPLRQLPSGVDGPPLEPAPDLLNIPDAVPRIEPLRVGGPNKPYDVAGVHYVPMTRDEPLAETGLASWYGRKFHGRATASGERYDVYAMTAAHPTMPIPSYARVHNPANGREVVVRVNDRGPFAAGRIIDLSYAAAVKLGVARGVAPVRVTRLTHADILAQAPSEAPALAEGAAATAGVAAPKELTEQALPAAPAAPVERAYTQSARGFWLQFGAFSRQEGAVDLRRDVAARAEWLAPLLTLFADGRLHRVQAGPFASRGEAQEAAAHAQRSVALTPIVIERR